MRASVVASARRRRDLQAPIAAFRAALLVLCAVLGLIQGSRTYAVLPIALLGVLAIAADRVPVARRHPVAFGVVEAVVAALGVVGTGGSTSPLLPYLLAAPMCIGFVAGGRAVAAVSLAAVGALLFGRSAFDSLHGDNDPLRAFLLNGGQFVALGFALGVVAGRARALAQVAVDRGDRFAEARVLLRELRAISRRLPGGLDAASAAEAVLEGCGEEVTTARSAVLVQPYPGALVPLAVRGTRRSPWRAPLSEPGPLRTAWETRAPVVDVQESDPGGRPRETVMAVLPLLAEGVPFGLVVLETLTLDAFSPAVVAALEELVGESTLRLETALLFDEVRSAVTAAERDRMAREVHDGVAQDLAFLGYQLDDLRTQAEIVDEPLAARVADLRAALSNLISNLRLSITDLKTSVGSERGLGWALSSYIRDVGSGPQLAVHLSLEESAFRLPGEQEFLLFQVGQAVAEDVRRSGTARNLWAHLSVDPPYAHLLVEHDGKGSPEEDLAPLQAQLAVLGGSLTVGPREGGGMFVDAVLKGGTDVFDGHAGR